MVADANGVVVVEKAERVFAIDRMRTIVANPKRGSFIIDKDDILYWLFKISSMNVCMYICTSMYFVFGSSRQIEAVGVWEGQSNRVLRLVSIPRLLQVE